MIYFKHKTLKHMFKYCKSKNKKLQIDMMVDNSIGWPPYFFNETIRPETLKYELWVDQATHHYKINNTIDLQIPADAERLNYSWSCLKYEWRDGPTNYIHFTMV